MKLIVCLDLNNGMMFNNRRQSKDAKVCENIIRYIKDKKLWINEYSKELFDSQNVFVDEDIFSKANKDDYCFIENLDVSDVVIDELIIYRWDKVYPADKKFNYNYRHMNLKGRLEFSGKSHEKIIREVYVNEEI